jgi:transcription elongation factor
MMSLVRGTTTSLPANAVYNGGAQSPAFNSRVKCAEARAKGRCTDGNIYQAKALTGQSRTADSPQKLPKYGGTKAPLWQDSAGDDAVSHEGRVAGVLGGALRSCTDRTDYRDCNVSCRFEGEATSTHFRAS